MNTGDTHVGNVSEEQFKSILSQTEKKSQVSLKNGVQYVDYGTSMMVLPSGKHVTINHLTDNYNKAGIGGISLRFSFFFFFLSSFSFSVVKGSQEN